MSDSINGLNRLSAGSQGYKPKGRPGSETDRRISGTTDSVTVGRPFEENNVIPAPEVKSVPVCDKPALAGLVESEKYLNAIDATAPMLPPTVQMAINPPGQGLVLFKDSGRYKLPRTIRRRSCPHGGPQRGRPSNSPAGFSACKTDECPVGRFQE